MTGLRGAARPWHQRWPRYYRWHRGLGYGVLEAALRSVWVGGARLRAYRRGPAR